MVRVSLSLQIYVFLDLSSFNVSPSVSDSPTSFIVSFSLSVSLSPYDTVFRPCLFKALGSLSLHRSRRLFIVSCLYVPCLSHTSPSRSTCWWPTRVRSTLSTPASSAASPFPSGRTTPHTSPGQLADFDTLEWSNTDILLVFWNVPSPIGNILLLF